jgi:hypothetical protein
MTVITGLGLFEDLRAAQNGRPRAARLRAGRHGRRCYGEAGVMAWAPEAGISGRMLVILPSHVQAGKTGAMAHHGVVQVLVPKSPGPRAKRIPVRDGQLGAAVPVGVKTNGS